MGTYDIDAGNEHREPQAELVPAPTTEREIHSANVTTIAAELNPANARNESVAKMLDAAYQRASTLELTEEESAKLMAAFDASEICRGAGGDQNLLYLEHASCRRRLMEVFGPGRWSCVTRRLWAEELPNATRVYAECVLLVRGCYVGEAIGAGSYFKSNGKQNYSDAAEAAQSEALRRIAGKYLGVGLQLWNKAYCAEWKKANSPQQGSEQWEPSRATHTPDREHGQSPERGAAGVTHAPVAPPISKPVEPPKLETATGNVSEVKVHEKTGRIGVVINGTTYGTDDKKLGEAAEAFMLDYKKLGSKVVTVTFYRFYAKSSVPKFELTKIEEADDLNWDIGGDKTTPAATAAEGAK